MFNGIIHNKGKVVSLVKNKERIIIGLKTNLFFSKKDIGCSVNCNGVCLTLISVKNKKLFFYISIETIKKSNFNTTIIGDFVNVEKSLVFGNKISGHYVQGHVDCTAIVSNIKIVDESWILSLRLKGNFKKYLIEKASVSINGVSLTISKLTNNGFEITIIPHTLKLTNLIKLKKNDTVNVEIDIFSKYLVKISN
jgi:riboflavin synthase